LLKKALSEDSEIVDIHHAGTAMRFLTSYYSIQEGKTTILTGSKRMKERPIKNLVTAFKIWVSKSNIWKMKDFRLLKFTEEKLRRPKWMFRRIFPASLSPLSSDCRKTGKRTGNKSGWQSDFKVLY
jgi:hypothetical protein